MFRCERALLACVWLTVSLPVHAVQPWHTLGQAISAADLAPWDIDVRPDGRGLPPGSGSVADGQTVYDAQCASCHGTFGESNAYIALAGGIGTLASATPQRTVGSKLSYATTLWDYINRAMPFNNAKTLTANQVYAVTAYVLNLNEIVAADAVLDEKSLPQVVMPNRDGFTTAHGFATLSGQPDVSNRACMHACPPAEVIIQSQLPTGFTAQLYGDIRTHFRHFDPAGAPAAVADSSAPTGLTLAQAHGCFACHDLDQARVGPAFALIGPHYAGAAAAAGALTAKVRSGGSGVWGAVPMPPQAQISDADLTRVVGWILQGARPK